MLRPMTDPTHLLEDRLLCVDRFVYNILVNNNMHGIVYILYFVVVYYDYLVKCKLGSVGCIACTRVGGARCCALFRSQHAP